MKMELSEDVKALERKFDQMFREMWSGRMPVWPSSSGKVRRSFSPSSDLFRRGDDLVARVELPGIDPEKDLEVQIKQGDLIIKGSRHESEEIEGDDYYRKELWQGSYERHLSLPPGVADSDVTAEYNHGVLEVTVRGAGKVSEQLESDVKTIPVHIAK